MYFLAAYPVRVHVILTRKRIKVSCKKCPANSIILALKYHSDKYFYHRDSFFVVLDYPDLSSIQVHIWIYKWRLFLKGQCGLPKCLVKNKFIKKQHKKTYLNARLWKLNFHRDLFSHKNIRVSGFCEQCFQDVELGSSECCPFSALFSRWCYSNEKNES